MIRKIILSALAFPVLSLTAQESFKELNDKDISKMTVRHHTRMQGPYDDGHGTVPNLKGKELPKRIALVSFYSFDKGSIGKKSFKTPIYEYKVTSWTTDAGASALSNVFASAAVPKIVAEFKKAGMDVLVPDQYLTDDAKKSAYNNFEPDISWLSKALMTQDDNFKSQAGASGYLVKPAFAPFDFKTGISFGQLAKDLGVDAVMVVVNELSNSDNEFRYDKLGIHVYGPNPIGKVEGKKYPGLNGAGYNEGQLYEGEDLVTKGIPFIVTKGKKKGEYLDGYDEMVAKLAGNVANWISQQTKGIDK